VDDKGMVMLMEQMGNKIALTNQRRNGKRRG
jgi:hypothetical protein